MVVLLATVLTVAITARLGVWQLDRAAQKTALHDARRRKAAAAAGGSRAGADGGGARRSGTARRRSKACLAGRRTVYLDNRPMNGRPASSSSRRCCWTTAACCWCSGAGCRATRRPHAHRPVPHRQRAGAGGRPHRPHAVAALRAGRAASGPIRQNLDLADHRARDPAPAAAAGLVQDRQTPATATAWPASGPSRRPTCTSTTVMPSNGSA
jgi:surfeit locus 1 family protein